MRKIFFYHAGCPDGFGSAWAAWKSWGYDAQYIPRGHNERLGCTNFDDDFVVFADNVPSPHTLCKLGERVQRLVVLDHHLSSQQQFARDPEVGRFLAENGHFVQFDLNHSGAVLAWQFFHPGHPAPPLLLYVEDQDLWNWKLPQSAEVNAALSSYPRTFEVWSELAALPIEALAQEGVPILRAQRRQIEHALDATHELLLGDQRIEAVNNASHLRSQIGHELALRCTYGKPWGLLYRLQGKHVEVSLYSIGDCDVSKLAVEYGGGGHRNAAGFHIALRDWLELLP